MATTIAAFNVKLLMDAKNYIQKSKLVATETNRVRREIDMARTPQEKYQRTLNLVSKALREKAIEQGVANRIIGAARAKYLEATTAAKTYFMQLIQGVRDIHLASIGVQMALRNLAIPVKAAADLQQTQITLETLAGDRGTAQRLIESFRELARTTPLTFKAVSEAGRKLMIYQFAADELIPTIRMLGDATAGNVENFKSMVLAYGQARAAGKLMGTELRQMTEAGFNPLEVASQKNVKRFAELQEEMRKGNITFFELTKMFQMATDEGGRYHNMMANVGKELPGTLARIESAVQILVQDLGTSLIPAVEDVATALETWAPHLKSATRNMGALLSLSLRVRNAIAGPSKTVFGVPLEALKDISRNWVENLQHAYKLALALRGTSEDQIKTYVELRKTYPALVKWLGKDITHLLDAYEAAQQKFGRSREQINADLEKQFGTGEGGENALDKAKAAFEAKEKHEKALFNLQKQVDKNNERHAQEMARQEEARKQSRISALKAAQQFFEQERNAQMRRRQQMLETISGGTGLITSGSSQAGEYLQRQRIQARIASNPALRDLARVNAQPTDQQLLIEARRQKALMEAELKKQNQMAEHLKRIEQNTANNKFQRIR